MSNINNNNDETATDNSISDKTSDKKNHAPMHAKVSEKSDANETSLDFSKFKNFFQYKKFNAVLITTLLILIPVLFSFYIRLTPEYLPQTDVWAESSVDNFYRNQISSTVNSQYPNLPQANKDQLINQQFTEFKKNNQASMDQQVKDASQYFKTGFQYEENGYIYTFLGDLDSYFYLRQARNIEEKGMVCDEIKDGVCWDTHLLAPLGSEVTPSLHPYGIVFVHKTLGFFDKSINLMKSSFLLPAILAAIACIAAFFIGRILMNEVAGFFAAMLIALNPMLITRTLGSDTDIWNITLPLVIIWVFLEAFETESLVKKAVLSGVAGLFMGIFAFAWGGWWYVFDSIIAAVFAYFAVTLVKNYIRTKSLSPKVLLSREITDNIIIVGVIFITSAIFVTLFVNYGTFIAAFSGPLSTFTALKAAAKPDLWPNVFTTVAELSEASLAGVVSQTAFGLNWLFAFALLGIVFTLIKREPSWKEYVLIGASFLLFAYLVSPSGLGSSTYVFAFIMMIPIIAAVLLFLFEHNSKVDLKPAFLFIIWFVGMTIASIKGVRFILLLTPIFAIAVGAAAGYLYQYLARVVKKELHISQVISNVAVFLVLCMILITPVKAGISAGENFTPSMTKGWWDSLTKIKTESAPNAIINSWWDFGHWFKFVAQRSVSLDGVTQNHPNAHWLGLILQTSSEREALGILRMLDCGSNNAFDEVNKKFQDSEKSENIVSELVKIDKKEGEQYLKSLGFNQDEVATISSLTYCNPPEDYFITSEDMIGKAGVWAHFGLWDFDRAYMINEVKPKTFEEGTRLLVERFNYSESQAAATYYELQSLQTDREMNDWIAPWPSYFTQDWLNSCKPVGGRDATLIDNTTNMTLPAIPPTSIACGINAVVSQDQLGGRNIIEGVVYDYQDPANSSAYLVGLNSAGQRTGSARAMPAGFVIVTNTTTTRTQMQNSTFPFDIVIDAVNNRVLMVAPELAQSMFTKLYYLDGKGLTGFEKFSDMTDITGLRIVVWKVNWEALD